MEVRVTLRPGQRGTKKLVERFGDRLICVRYRYDVTSHRRVTSVELVVDEAPWTPSAPANMAETVAVRVNYDESALRQKVKQAGGRWNAERRVWLLPFGRVRALGLVDRIASPR